MQFLRDMSIRNKLMIVVMFSCGIVFLLAAIASMSYDNHYTKSSMVQDLAILTDVISSNSTAALAFNNQDDATETLMALRAQKHVTAACIYSQLGNQFATYTNNPIDLIPKNLPIIPNGSRFGENSLEMIRPIKLDGEQIGVVYVQMDLLILKARMKGLATAATIMIVLAFTLVFIIVAGLQRVISVPILGLASTARQISTEKDYSVRVDVRSADEVGALVKSFNGMLEQIQHRDQELLEAHNKLESRVHERTLELQNTNEHLRQEITDRVRAEDLMAISLQEKEVLLKEIHHRVKNNLQIIASLLSLQASKIADDNTKSIFRDSQGRVKSMALIHERLYRSDNLAEIVFSDYVENLTRFLMSTISGNLGRITITQDIQDIVFGVDTAVPCGLIINELVTNSLKHAFSENENGEIHISCKRIDNNHISLCISDNGTGIKENIDIKNTQSLGMQLVHSLTDQLDGKIQLDNEYGTKFTIEFEHEFIEQKEVEHVGV
jgi:two-component sensor histidine kinase/HAMP domain-containing protein